jgi:hypothetical protein
MIRVGSESHVYEMRKYEAVMKAAILKGYGQPLQIDEVQIDPPRTGEVQLRIGATGVCHSDYHVIKGEWKYGVAMILGHEAAGVVKAVGPNVRLAFSQVTTPSSRFVQPAAHADSVRPGEDSITADAGRGLFGAQQSHGQISSRGRLPRLVSGRNVVGPQFPLSSGLFAHRLLPPAGIPNVRTTGRRGIVG